MARNRSRRALPQEDFVLDIEKLSHEGRGIGHRDGKVVFVDEALPGERVRARTSDRRGGFDEAAMVEVLEASPQRVRPLCAFASACGGCSLQHFDSDAQIAFKSEVLHEKLRHSLGRDDYDLLEPVTGPAFHYRRKARLGVRYVAKRDEVLVGFREKRGNFITAMDACQVLEEPAAAVLPALAGLIRGLEAYQQIPQVEVAVGDAVEGSTGLALVFRHLRPLSGRDMERLRAFCETHAAELYLQPAGPESVHKVFPGGPERLYYTLPDFDLTLAFHPLDFTQVNAAINRRMLARALELLAPGPEDRILDLFCGLGNFTLPLARRCREVVGVEGVPDMVRRGAENAARNGIRNAAFHCADLAQAGEGQPWLQGGFDRVLLDPPRSGAQEVLPALTALRPERIVYISCNPATLARDAALLEAQGYPLRAAGVLDMFPQTAHVESIALFTRRTPR